MNLFWIPACLGELFISYRCLLSQLLGATGPYLAAINDIIYAELPAATERPPVLPGATEGYRGLPGATGAYENLACRDVNPHHEEASRGSAQWVQSFGLFSPKAQVAFDRCNFGLLAALAYPLLKKEHLRSAADFMAALYCFDEYTDQGDEAFVRQAADIVKDALRNPFKSRSEGEMPIGEVFRQFLARMVPISSATVQQRLVETQERAMDAQVQQCVDRKHDFARNSEEYLPIRLHSSSMLPSISFRTISSALVVKRSIIGSLWLRSNATPGSKRRFDYLGALHDRTKDSFLETTKNLPTWGEPIDSEVRRYIDGIGNWGTGELRMELRKSAFILTPMPRKCAETLQLTMLPKVVVADSQEHWAPRLGEVIPGLETALELVPDAGYLATKVAV
ncbi:isoprenoid synthase domain-containing protein [Mycena olivaceomarginata]|nr:isoprenoid synthase domain-containing protein [Mycena olivaceomarginata]